MYLIHSYSHSFRTRDVKAGKVYDVVFRVTDERGNVRQKRLSGFATKQNAEKAFVEYVAKFCTLVEDHPSRSECPSFAAVADKYLEYSRFMNAASTAIKRMSYFSLHYLPRFGALPLNRISSADVFRWFDALVSEPRRGTDKCYAPRSLRSIWEQLHAFFEWCSERYSVPNPMRGLKRPRMKAPEKLLAFWEQKEFEAFAAEFLFCTARGGRLPHSTVRRNFAQSIQIAGARRIRLHDLRHSYVSLLVHKGANLAVIADLIGDTIEQVTNTYAHLYENDRKNIISLLNS